MLRKPSYAGGLAVVLAFGVGACSKPFTDVTARTVSPDGAIVAASVMNAPGFGLYLGQGVTLSSLRGDPLTGTPVLTYGEDDRPPSVRWVGVDRLEVALPCGWWGQLSNHWQLQGTNRIVDISYRPAPTSCPGGNYARGRPGR